jgi:hypothetical protein
MSKPNTEPRNVIELREFIIMEHKKKKDHTPENAEKVADAILAIVKTDRDVQSFMKGYKNDQA